MKPFDAEEVYILVDSMRWCRERKVSFTACLAEARRQFQKEVQQEANAKNLDDVGSQHPA